MSYVVIVFNRKLLFIGMALYGEKRIVEGAP